MSKLTEELISGVVLHAGNFFELHRDVVRLPDGSQAVRDYLRHPCAVAIVALTAMNVMKSLKRSSFLAYSRKEATKLGTLHFRNSHKEQ